MTSLLSLAWAFASGIVVSASEIDCAANLHAKPHCFTPSMQVRTPHGGRLIGQFMVHDEVTSFDLVRHRFVTNQVRRIVYTKNEPYGRLVRGRAFFVTPRQRFYAQRDGVNGYYPIEDLSPKDLLFRSDVPVKRGVFEPNVDRGTVIHLELEFAPHNFFVEGFLVHNFEEQPG